MDNEATLTHLYEQRRELIRRLNTVEEQITKRLIHDTEAHAKPASQPQAIVNNGSFDLWPHQRSVIRQIQNPTGDAA